MTPTLALPPIPHAHCNDRAAVEWTTTAIERLELLMPNLASRQRSIRAYALEFVEQFESDVLQLEHERAFLLAAITWAWQQDDYAAVARLVAGLSVIAGRLDVSTAEAVMWLGLRATRALGDRRQHVMFLNRFAGLLLARGRYRHGRRLWNSSLRAAQNDTVVTVWKPLASFAYIADLLKTYDGARDFASMVLHARDTYERHESAETVAIALLMRGFYARTTGNLDTGYECLSESLRVFSAPGNAASPRPLSHDRQLVTLVVLAELARIRGDMSGAASYADSAIALAQVFSDAYTVAALRTDQRLFTSARRHTGDAPAALTGRELELLHLVAVGLSNQDIARRLVVTTGTVKKHLEHIYAKLDVRSRTAAVAAARHLALLR